MSLKPETIETLKRKAASLAECSTRVRSAIGQVEEALRDLDSGVTALLAEDVRSVSAAVRSYHAAYDPSRALEQLRQCLEGVREVVNAARAAGYQDQRAPATPRA